MVDCDFSPTNKSAWAFDELAVVIRNELHCQNTYSLVLKSPKIAKSIRAGQFVHLEVGEASLILRRPFSVFMTSGEHIEILYQIVGKGTKVLSHKQEGEKLRVLGPLGNPWPLNPSHKLALLVAGGLGAAPLGMLIPSLHNQGTRIEFAQGAYSSKRIVAHEYFSQSPCNRCITTNDGSFGEKGFVTSSVEELLKANDFNVAYICGPEPMMKAVSKLCLDAGVDTYISLEKRMACGVGACLGCVVETVRGKERSCLEGPVFKAEDVLW